MERKERSHRGRTAGTGYLLLWTAFFGLIIAAPALTGTTPGAVAVAILSSVLLLSILLLIGERGKSFAAAVVLLVISLVLRLLYSILGGIDLLALSCLFTVLILALVSLMMYEMLFKDRKVTTETIWQGMTLYLTIGLAWAYLFAFVNAVLPGSFLDRAAPGSVPGLPDLIYYSFVTLTTVGYGDIQPITAEARGLAVMEMLFGVLYLAIFISRLVETWKVDKGTGR